MAVDIMSAARYLLLGIVAAILSGAPSGYTQDCIDTGVLPALHIGKEINWL